MTHRKAIDAFLAKKAEIDAQLARLQALSDDHFEVNPDTVNWGHVGDLSSYAEKLREITDAAFREGEHAPERGRSFYTYNAAGERVRCYVPTNEEAAEAAGDAGL